MSSYLYEGWVRHRRFTPVEHSFSYRLSMLYLDLDQLQEAFSGSWLFSMERLGLASFRRADHLGDPAEPLSESVRTLVQQQTGTRPAGPIRLLTYPRYFGYVMNPVSFYYCFDAADSRVETIVAEVTNTPWRERRNYVLATPTEQANGTLRFRFAKDFHVSPFMPMAVDYDWRFVTPGQRLAVHMTNFENESRSFDASMTLERRAMTPANLRRSFVRYPLMTAKVVAAIYWQALRLRLRGTPYYEHPKQELIPAASPESQP